MYSLAKRFFASFVFACVLVGTGYAGMVRVDAAAQPPRIIMYQGRLLNSNGVPVSDATASVSFSLYTAASGGTCLWSNSASDCATAVARTVTLTSGLFSEALGDGAAAVPYSTIPPTVFSNNGSVYLEVVVNGETLAPRKAMLAAPYAMNADAVDGFDTTAVGATSSMVPITDAFGNLVITGAPQGSGVGQGSIYINPDTGVVAANETLLGVAVSGVAKFTIDGEGDTTILGDAAINGGDFTSSSTSFAFLNTNVTTLAMAGAATTLHINNTPVTSAINIGGTTQDGTNTVSIATNATSPDSVSIGNINGTSAVSIIGGTAWSIAGNGLMTTSNDLEVNGGDISSTAALKVASGGAGALTLDSATGLIIGAGGDDFAVGANSLVAPFSVDESGDTVRIGDGVNDADDPAIVFYASDATNIGKFYYADTDTFTFSDGKVSTTFAFTQNTLGSGGFTMTNNVLTVSGASPAATNQTHISLGGTMTYSGSTGAGSTTTALGVIGEVDISAVSSVLNSAVGVTGVVYNQSTNASVLNGAGYLAGGAFSVQHDSAQTVSTVYGSNSTVMALQGVISKGVAVNGEILNGGGAFTTGMGGSFMNTTEGATRYGIFASASGGGTANYSGYFSAALAQVDTDATADAMTIANAAGDLGISNDLENHGSGRFGDLAGTDDFVFSSALTSQPVVQILGPSLTTGVGLGIQRTNDGTGTTFSGRLVTIQQNDVSAGGGAALEIVQNGAGTSVGLFITQTNTSAHVADTPGNNALVIDIGEAGSTDDAIMMRSNVPGAPDTEFRVTTQGDAYVDGAFTGGGADFAEFFATRDSALADQYLACQDGSLSNAVKRCEAGNAQIVGVISTNPAFIGNNIGDGTEDLRGNPLYRLVGLVGQIDTKVTTSDGAIAVGDPISTSSISAGMGAKAHGPVRIVGFALEPLSSGTGVIRILVNPQWYGGDVLTATGSATQVAGSLAIAATTAATASSTAVDSATLSLRGSAWSGSSAETVGMSLKTAVSAVNDYRLSITNSAGTEVASVGNTGDLAIAGRLYPSDRGASQKSKYIYYDGSSGSGGDFMRTNSAGWATGSYDFAEMFPSPDALVPGEIVVFGDASQQVKRSTGEVYSRTIAGIVSTRPGFLAGENREGNYPVALAGRVPTLVSTENGAIHIGDPLTTSSRPGYAMKATEAGPILGYAAEAFAGSTGSVIVYVNVSYYSGAPVAQGPAADNTVSQLAQDIENFDTAGTLNFNGGQLLAVGSMTSASGAWRLESDGDVITSGRLIELVRSAQGTDVETYAAASRQMTVQISGMVNLVNGRADVRFADIDPSFVGIVDENPTYRALVTPYGATGALYVTNRTVDGFSIAESGTASTGVSVDWLVIATRRDYVPVTENIAPVVPAAPAVSPTPSSIIDIGSDSGAPSSDGPIPSLNSDIPSGDVMSPVVDAPVPEVSNDAIADPSVVVDAPVAPDSGSDTVVSDTPAPEPSAPAPSSDSLGGEVSL